MADIKTSIKFSKAQQRLITEKLNDSFFSHINWGDQSLLGLRRAIRLFYRKMQKGVCSYCKNDISLVSVANCHVEHIVPKSKYKCFIFEPKNLCVICADCSEIKRNQEVGEETIDTIKGGHKRKLYPRSSSAFKIVHPHFDNFNDHILILPGGYYVDKSKKGHFTIGVCMLNRKLYKFGSNKEAIDNDDLCELMNDFLDESKTDKREALLRKINMLAEKKLSKT